MRPELLTAKAEKMRPTLPIPTDRLHAFLVEPVKNYEKPLVDSWEVWFRQTGMAYERRGNQLYVHRFQTFTGEEKGRWCCEKKGTGR